MKEKSTYMMLCAVGGLFGLHQFYLGNFGRGIFYMLTAGGFLIGWLGDLLNASRIVDEHNTKRGYLNTKSRNKKSQ